MEGVKKAIRRIKKTGKDGYGDEIRPPNKFIAWKFIHPRHKRKGGE